ncbi:MAG: YggT family protein [Bacillota bacterium]|nr:YggT family protein [Bacillota bacterium]
MLALWVRTAFEVYTWLILLRALLSWLNLDWRHPVLRFLYDSTEVLLAPIRRALPGRWEWGIDLSPLVAILLLQVVERVLLSLL